MKRYLFNDKLNYKLQKKNIYVQSASTFIRFTQKNNYSRKIISELKDKYSKFASNKEITNLRNNNHTEYNNLDIEFIKNVDVRYKKQAEKILTDYQSISYFNLLKLDFTQSLKVKNDILNLKMEINLLKDEVTKDLMSVIDYVDNMENRINVENIKKDNQLGILILNKYQSLKLFSSKLDLQDVNFEMKHQAKRLIYIKEIEALIKDYSNKKSIYNKDNTTVFINNLYDIISNYIYLLSDVEFCFTKEAIKKILAYEYEFIDKYLPTYRIILNRIWNTSITPELTKDNFCYIVCDIDLKDDKLYLINNHNIDKSAECGYICQLPNNFILDSSLDKIDIMMIPLPLLVMDKYELKIKIDMDLISIKGIYSQNKNAIFDSTLPVLYL